MNRAAAVARRLPICIHSGLPASTLPLLGLVLPETCCMTVEWITDTDTKPDGLPIEKASLGWCDLAVMPIEGGGCWWLVSYEDEEFEGQAASVGAAKREAIRVAKNAGGFVMTAHWHTQHDVFLDEPEEVAWVGDCELLAHVTRDGTWRWAVYHGERMIAEDVVRTEREAKEQAEDAARRFDGATEIAVAGDVTLSVVKSC
jgi:hypothetical protein